MKLAKQLERRVVAVERLLDAVLDRFVRPRHEASVYQRDKTESPLCDAAPGTGGEVRRPRRFIPSRGAAAFRRRRDAAEA
jgi:hypothetical protein